MCLVVTLSVRSTLHPVATGPHILWQLLQRVRAAAPHLAIHLFRSASDRILCSCDSSSSNPYDPDKPRGQGKMDEAAVAHISAYVDEVGGGNEVCIMLLGRMEHELCIGGVQTNLLMTDVCWCLRCVRVEWCAGDGCLRVRSRSWQ